MFVCIGVDTLACLDNGFKLYFFSTNMGFDVGKMLHNTGICYNDNCINLSNLLDVVPGIFGRVCYDFESYLQFLARALTNKLNGRKVVVWLSGGKDSTASLITLLELQKYLNFDLKSYYIHVPLLDGERNLKFIDLISKKLDVEIGVESISKEKMKDLLEHYGLPYRGFRWCTYHAKIRVMRQIKKGRFDYEVNSERIFESYKRFCSLLEYAKQRTFISGTQLKPLYILTILDVIDLVKARGVVHPDYIRGCSRISCSICPYRTVFELEKTANDLEDPGFIDLIMQKTYLQEYQNVATFDDYEKYALWRFQSNMAGKLLALKKCVEKMEQSLKSEDVDKILSYVWMNSLKAPHLEIDYVIKLITNAHKERKYGILNLGLEPELTI
ncbi:MAG: phosphoadenosine phosphosulfate reductase family protein [Candidatus Korarchaeota archaeon]